MCQFEWPMEKLIFRYLTPGKDFSYVQKAIQFNETFFRNPNTFNDPFDCAQSISIPDVDNLSLSDEDDLRWWFSLCMQEKHDLQQSHASSVEIRREADLGISKGNHKASEWLDSITISLPESVKESAASMAVACFSADPECILMWSHYADRHRGVVLIFNRDALLEDDGQDRLFPVTYSTGFPTLNEFRVALTTEGPLGVCKLFYCRKPRCWRYEREWRLFVSISEEDKNPSDGKSQEGVSRRTPEGSLVGVIMGCNMQPENRLEVKQWVDDRKEPLWLYEARCSHKGFALDIKRSSGEP